VELAPVERLRTAPAVLLLSLRDALRGSGLDERFLLRIARVGERLDDPLRAPMRLWHARRLREPAAIAARLFVLGDPVSPHDAAGLLGDLAPWGECKLLDLAGGLVTSRARLALAGDLYVFGDRGASPDEIPPLNGVTSVLARAAIPARPVLTSALDLGCGPGALALALARVAGRVVGTDVSARAVAWARWNATLNAAAPIALREGDLFAPLDGERFDLIVSQPPFLAHRREAARSNYGHGGARGDELALRALKDAPSHLTASGRAVFLADWPLFDGDPLDARVRAALGDVGAGAGVDALVLQSPAKNLDEYCTSLAAAEHPALGDAFARAACAQRDHFEALGIRGIAQALVVVQAAGRGGTAVVPVRHAHDAPITVDGVDRIVAAHALAWRVDQDVLDARLRLALGTRLVTQPGVHGAAAAVIVQLPAGRPEWPFATDPDVAAILQAIDGAPSVLQAANDAARRSGAPLDPLVKRFAAVARDGLRRGALELYRVF
jgi:hypothetical protein